MDVGALIFPTDKTIRPDRLAVALEERGYESLWVAEHTHIPLTRKTPYPAGGELPDFYKRTMDPFVALSVAATVTSQLKLGTGICLVNQHHAINLAKQCASVDLVSNGRFLFGVGVGWNEDEMEHHGVDPSKRRSTARERILAVKELWSQQEAEFHGDYVDFSPSLSYPKPVRIPPVIMGGSGGPVTFKHVIEYCDGWMPIGGSGSGGMENMANAMAARGRDMQSLEIGRFGAPLDEAQARSRLEQGFTHLVFGLPQSAPDAVLARLDEIAALVEKLR